MKNIPIVLRAVAMASCFALPLSAGAQTGQPTDRSHPKAVTPDQVAFKNMPELPRCLTVGVVQGDPMTGPSTVILKFAAGCDSTMHWHSPNEQLVMIKGNGSLQIQGEAPRQVMPGAYNMQPSKHPHRFICGAGGECQLYLFSDAKFDIHYVDASGKEISLEQALKASASPMRR